MRRLALAAALGLAGLCSVAAVASAAAPFAKSNDSFVLIFNGASHAAELAARPLTRSLELFRAPRRSSDRLPATLVSDALPGLSLAAIVRALKGDPGRPLTGESRALEGQPGIYVVPTRNGWACFVGGNATACDRGLLQQDVTWHYTTAGARWFSVFGLAGDDVRSVTLVYRGHAYPARLAGNAFTVTAPTGKVSSAAQLARGTLRVAYRTHRATSTVPLR